MKLSKKEYNYLKAMVDLSKDNAREHYQRFAIPTNPNKTVEKSSKFEIYWIGYEDGMKYVIGMLDRTIKQIEKANKIKEQ